jgi:hypothetical protein
MPHQVLFLASSKFVPEPILPGYGAVPVPISMPFT